MAMYYIDRKEKNTYKAYEARGHLRSQPRYHLQQWKGHQGSGQDAEGRRCSGYALDCYLRSRQHPWHVAPAVAPQTQRPRQYSPSTMPF